jgi:hypothetical protein
MKLYHHKTSGGAEYLFDTYLLCDYCNKCKCETPNDGNKKCFCCGDEKHKEGVLNNKTKYIIRIDGDITKDAELTLKHYLCPSCGYNIAGLNDETLKKMGIIK